MRTYNVLIIEDEIPAQANLRRAIERQFDDLRVVGIESSVSGAVAWLGEEQNVADIIFMDVELSDGSCFDIFKQCQVKGKVIITTAFDNYAVQAFRVNSIDYLLKPIDPELLRAAVDRCRTALEAAAGSSAPFNIEALRNALNPEANSYKKRFVVKFGDRLSVIDTSQIAYFYAEDKSNYLVTNENRCYILDSSLDTVSEQVSPNDFFRISRNCTVAIRSIAGISKHPSGRLKVQLEPRPTFEVFVSRSRTADFLQWLEGK